MHLFDLDDKYSIHVVSTSTDRTSLKELFERGLLNHPISFITPDWDKTIDCFAKGSLKDQIAILLMFDQKPVGVFCAVKNNAHPLGVVINTALEVLWWVDAEHRGKHSIKLIDYYEAWAKEVGCSRCSIGHLDDEHGKRLSFMYKELGYRPIEHVYIKEL